jgi:bacterioferritin-associated ferredoxin
MIYCICLNVAEAKIKELKEQGFSWEEIKLQLGIGVDCGTCLDGAFENPKTNS